MDDGKPHLTSPGSNLTLRRQLEPLFLNYKIDIVLNGHDHAYERSHPVFDGTVAEDVNQDIDDLYVNPSRPIHIRVGTGGISLDTVWSDPLPAWSAKRISAHGFSIFDLSIDERKLTVSFMASTGTQELP